MNTPPSRRHRHNIQTKLTHRSSSGAKQLQRSAFNKPLPPSLFSVQQHCYNAAFTTHNPPLEISGTSRETISAARSRCKPRRRRHPAKGRVMSFSTQKRGKERLCPPATLPVLSSRPGTPPPPPPVSSNKKAAGISLLAGSHKCHCYPTTTAADPGLGVSCVAFPQLACIFESDPTSPGAKHVSSCEGVQLVEGEG